MFHHSLKLLVLVGLLGSPLLTAEGQDREADVASEGLQLVEHPIAVLPFRERGKEVKDRGGQVADLLFAKLIVDPGLNLVDREDLDQTLGEAELTLSGVVSPQEAIAVGHLTGARLILTGSVFQIGNKTYLVAKIIGTETSRVVGASVNGAVDGDVGELADQLGDVVIRTIKQRSDTLVARTVKKVDRIAALKKQLGDAKRPAILISVDERHVGQQVIDPAARTELMLFCKETGFDVIDVSAGATQQAKYVIRGEGISEFATRRGNLISVKARLEVKVVDRASGKVVAVDRQTRIAVDLVEQIAGKQALQDAAADIAERILPKLVQGEKE